MRPGRRSRRTLELALSSASAAHPPSPGRYIRGPMAGTPVVLVPGLSRVSRRRTPEPATSRLLFLAPRLPLRFSYHRSWRAGHHVDTLTRARHAPGPGFPTMDCRRGCEAPPPRRGLLSSGLDVDVAQQPPGPSEGPAPRKPAQVVSALDCRDQGSPFPASSVRCRQAPHASLLERVLTYSRRYHQSRSSSLPRRAVPNDDQPGAPYCPPAPVRRRDSQQPAAGLHGEYIQGTPASPTLLQVRRLTSSRTSTGTSLASKAYPPALRGMGFSRMSSGKP